jgi:hypothetical protein
MKTVRLFSIAMAVVLLVVALVPFAAAPASAQTSASQTTASPAQAFMDAARGLPLLAPMSIAAPVISLSIENTNSAGNSYSCSLVKQSPADWVKMKSRQNFDMNWTVQNTGAVWYADSTKLSYVGGTKMQTRGDSFTLSSDVARGKKVKLSVDMTAPKNLGTYTTLWALYAGNTRFCKVTLVLTVVR